MPSILLCLCLCLSLSRGMGTANRNCQLPTALRPNSAPALSEPDSLHGCWQEKDKCRGNQGLGWQHYGREHSQACSVAQPPARRPGQKRSRTKGGRRTHNQAAFAARTPQNGTSTRPSTMPCPALRSLHACPYLSLSLSANPNSGACEQR